MSEIAAPTELLQVAARLRLAVTRLNRKLRAEGEFGLTPSAMAALASVARHGPLSLGELAAAEGVKPPTITATVAGLEAEGLVARELDSLDRRYLRALIENYAGGPAGVETLAYAIAEARDAVEDVIEPFLLQQGFIQRTPRGRMAAAKAYAHLGLAAPPPAGKPPAADLFE